MELPNRDITKKNFNWKIDTKLVNAEKMKSYFIYFFIRYVGFVVKKLQVLVVFFTSANKIFKAHLVLSPLEENQVP